MNDLKEEMSGGEINIMTLFLPKISYCSLGIG